MSTASALEDLQELSLNNPYDQLSLEDRTQLRELIHRERALVEVNSIVQITREYMSRYLLAFMNTIDQSLAAGEQHPQVDHLRRESDIHFRYYWNADDPTIMAMFLRQLLPETKESMSQNPLQGQFFRRFFAMPPGNPAQDRAVIVEAFTTASEMLPN